ncbi:YqaA family protein [Kangiella shandongensis]|uniref:YqaA family protein n=1 Tax=Kangiella shandongensis TaxID=2763258 RepID=UPI001CC16CCB|nr:hypothetical protein [Kangiella shandongensis]
MTKKCIAAGWGFAEATLFFILPDVLLSYFALERKERLMRLILWALAGAVAGGLIMYYWGFFAAETAWHWVEAVPAINSELMSRVGKQLGDTGATAIILGPLQGVPYKTYAVQAASVDIGTALFIGVSIAARLLRFVLIAFTARGISLVLMSHLKFSRKGMIIIWGSVWTVVYSLYFFYFPS